MSKNEQTIKEAIEALLKTYRLDGKLNEMKLIDSWEKLLGKVIAKHTTNLYISRKKLYVKLDSSVLREELSYASTKIIKMLNDEAGSPVIEEIIFQ